MTQHELIEKIKSFEGFRATAYDDLQPNKTLSKGDTIKGTLTIGYGRTQNTYIGEITTKEKENDWITSKIISIMGTVEKQLKQYNIQYNQNMVYALTSFTYNCGYTNLLRLLDFGNRTPDVIGVKILEYTKSKGIELKGLVNRRKWEHDLFFDKNVSRETISSETNYSIQEIQTLCNKIIRDKNLEYEPLKIDGIIGLKTKNLIFTLLYISNGYT